MRRSIFWSLLFSFTFSTFKAAVVLKGDGNAAENETFSFNLAHNDQTRSASQFAQYTYVAAAPDAVLSSADFAIARVARDSTSFVPMAPEKINFNPSKQTQDVDGQSRVVSVRNEITNPFYNNGVSFFSWFNGADATLGGSAEKLVMVAQNDLRTIFFLNNFSESNPQSNLLISAHNLSFAVLPGLQNIPDATGAVTSGIVGFAAEAPNVFAAVKPTDTNSVFGDVASGIALVVDGFIENLFDGPVVIDAPTFSAVRATGNRAAALDVTSDFLTISSDLASIGQVVDMHWFPQMQRLYIALQVTGSGGGTDGARAIAIGRIVTALVTGTDNGQTISEVRKTQFILEQIVPETVFDGAQDKVIGAVGSSAEVSIHKIRSMFASTAMPYLIGVGGVGSSSDTKRSVFALPVVTSNSDITKIGTIAKKDVAPEEFFGKTAGTNIPIFLSRGFTQQATDPADMPLATDAAVQVGGGDIINGDIVDLYVYQDTVWICVQEESDSQEPGIFYSHALFDNSGKIKGWTIWQREAGTIDKAFGIEFDPSTINKTFLSANSSSNVRTVKRTQWGAGDALAPIASTIDEQLVFEQGGVQGLFDFGITSTTLGTETPGLQTISMLIATGRTKVLLFETSRSESDVIIPNQASDFGVVELFDDGTITKTFPTGNNMISIQGGVLDTIGAINAAEIARDGSAGSNGWLIVGGVGGAAILSQADGSGWDAATKLDAGFDGLVAGMSFKTFGDYSFVRKIINDGQYLYVLTNTQLDRIDLTNGTPGLGTIAPLTIARAEDIGGVGGSFADAIISQKLAILAVNNGLVRIGDGQDVRSAINPVWQIIDTPEGIGPVRQLLAQSTTGRAQDISKNSIGGTLYALSAFSGKCQSQIFRYDIQQTETNAVSAQTVVQVPDLFIKDISSYFASFGLFRNILGTDGSIFMGSISKQLEDNPLITVLTSVRTMGIYTSFSSRPLFNKTVDAGIADSTIVSALLKNLSSGSWLVGSDGGLRINE